MSEKIKYSLEDILLELNTKDVNELCRGKLGLAFNDGAILLSEIDVDLLCNNKKFQNFIGACIWYNSIYFSVYDSPGLVASSCLEAYKERIGLILGDKYWFL